MAVVIFDEVDKCSKNRHRAGVPGGFLFVLHSGVVAMYGAPVRTVGWYVSISRLHRLFGFFRNFPKLTSSRSSVAFAFHPSILIALFRYFFFSGPLIL